MTLLSQKQLTRLYDSDDGHKTIIIDECGAVMSERVKNMKAEDMTAIFEKYPDDLGISASVGRQSVEYYG